MDSKWALQLQADPPGGGVEDPAFSYYGRVSSLSACFPFIIPNEIASHWQYHYLYSFSTAQQSYYACSIADSIKPVSVTPSAEVPPVWVQHRVSLSPSTSPCSSTHPSMDHIQEEGSAFVDAIQIFGDLEPAQTSASQK
ncbi:hypothetical protein PAXRUDRAFT_21638 [Paxillus rubicundulus Ve08.2h10]|uniref:Unplaced genomic scaffold scaffold_5671, whole genome shotgun sequence n=1 Tax=Paxillus rubicundulus Ve08.2h10 TaxID=930991 RepID=A0A0D0CZ23_9AGAM|nr:hypothetical protein PAXRUDRAFT_21638 [Paxillus rubicundulus Ve08.2h10]